MTGTNTSNKGDNGNNRGAETNNYQQSVQLFVWDDYNNPTALLDISNRRMWTPSCA